MVSARKPLRRVLSKAMQMHYHWIKSNLWHAFSMTETLSKMTLFAESKLTERYQTTLPTSVRIALGVEKHDKIAYGIGADGKVYLSKMEPEEHDPVLEKFAAFIANDIENHPENVRPIDPDLVARSRALIAGMDSDLDAPLEEDD